MTTSSHSHDYDEESAVLNRVNHTVVADPDTPQVIGADETGYPGGRGSSANAAIFRKTRARTCRSRRSSSFFAERSNSTV